jgi:hypothetical protein
MRRASLFAALALALTAVPTLAATRADVETSSPTRAPGGFLDGASHERHNLLSVMADIPFGYAGFGFPIGVGGSFYIPLAKDGFINKVNDEFGIEFGASITLLLGSSVGATLVIPVVALWMFHITPDFSAYATLGLSFRMLFYSPFSVFGGYGVAGFGGSVYWPVAPETGVGILWKLSPGMSLRAELGYPGIKVGLTFPM